MASLRAYLGIPNELSITCILISSPERDKQDQTMRPLVLDCGEVN